MKKKLILALFMSSLVVLSTGCTNSNNLSETMVVTGTNKDYITYDFKEWGTLMGQVAGLVVNNREENNDIRVEHDRPYDMESSIYTGKDERYIYINIDSALSKKALSYAANYMGEELNTFVQKIKDTKIDQQSRWIRENERGAVLTEKIGEYSLLGIRGEKENELYIFHEPFKFKNESDAAFMQAFQTDHFLLSGYSQGAEESLVEMSTPLRMTRGYVAYTTSYYQFFRDEKRELKKVRMIIDAYRQSPIEQAEFEPLKVAISALGGDDHLNEQIQEEVNKIINKSSQGKVIASDKVKCTIKYQQSYESESIIEVAVE